MKMEALKQRREELENKELDLRRSLEKFNTFLTVYDTLSLYHIEHWTHIQSCNCHGVVEVESQ